MTEIVVDASVFVSLFDRETENTKLAEKLIDLMNQGEILVTCPDLILLELTNVLVKTKRLEVKDVVKFARILESMGVEFMQLLPGDVEEVAKYMKKYSLTAYDACYLQLAEMSETLLITEDKELLKVKRCVTLSQFFAV
ncbi:MAG: hypothetical protein UW68_C0016G0018 [Candidatus Collierbacteria bacterium GW2011_GWB1_44_6]|uniref:PIN domain-containing protein n=2 Tax=Candidatus Collieribacteriota TaxID=1752725 RepID=A0A0G1JP96_9BACT|nr:MAG: hypothetical protein UV68_C0017G0015 [Candidatus Collierbacteria bacterium GW2011_GWC2_43_12]KKT73138.1 MAG: hypothetical protein UW68_C0016G0018 [Candidatus Collierbacteria bacterium GW2011_GWB1_44_6]KKT82975.1 MAG: hypothetical protein UW80_C0025G0008 [Microgenomates group bacterium GW2011_GWC1_44_9]